MPLTSKAKKGDLRRLVEELGGEVTDKLKVSDLRSLIFASKEYKEDSSYYEGVLEEFVLEREAKEKEEAREHELKLKQEILRLELERELKLKDEMLKLERREKEEAHRRELELIKAKQVTDDKIIVESGRNIDLQKLISKFDPLTNDISLYLELFERQVKAHHVPELKWVSQLISVLPTEVNNIIAREPEEQARDYNYVKELLLQRFKLSPEKFRQKFIKHQRDPNTTWYEFYHEIRNYLDGWLSGLEIKTFDELKELMITDQIKRKAPNDFKEHYIEEWATITCPATLVKKLEEFEDAQRCIGRKINNSGDRNFQKTTAPKFQRENFKKDFTTRRQQSWEKKSDNVIDKKKRIQCYECGEFDHIRSQCTKLKASGNWRGKNNDRGTFHKSENISSNLVTTENPTENKEVLSARITVPILAPIKANSVKCDELKRVELKCGSKIFNGILDTGAQISVIRHDLLPIEDGEGEGTVKLVCAFGLAETAPIVVFNMKLNDPQHCEVPIVCAVSKKLVSDMLICNTAFEALKENIQQCQSIASDVVSKQEVNESVKEISRNDEDGIAEAEILNKAKEEETNCKGNKAEFIKLQREDESLKDIWKLASERKNNFEVEDGLLLHSDWVCGEKIKQVVLPSIKRGFVLKTAHEIPLAGHLGEKKTKERIKYSFFWPTIKADVKKFCESCKPCQLRGTVTYRDRIPIQPITRPDNPFEIWSVDCIGPLEPPSRKGHKYIICAVDLCTRWAEAIPTKNINAKTTCDVLMQIFARTGFPKVICTDQGTNFTSKLTDAFMKLIGVSPRFSTPGHPESMGAVERWNRTLKNMLNKNIQEYGNEWDVHLPHLLFAYREVPHCATGVSPYQLVYGRIPQGPLSVLRDVWMGEKEIPTKASRSIETYLEDLTEKLRKAHVIAADNSTKAQKSYTHQYNLRAKEKEFNVGDKVLLLLPSSTHKLLNTWMGPGTVVELTRKHSARVKMEDGSIRELHFNKLRPYIARLQHVGLVFEQDEDFGELHYAPTDTFKENKDIMEIMLKTNNTLGLSQKSDLGKVLHKFQEVFSSRPGQANVEGHTVRVKDDCVPKRLKPYRIPITLQDEVDRQVKELLDLNLIEDSDSEWAHPVVCVAKKNGSVRLCVDYRHLNSFTIPDAYPMKIAKELLYEIGRANFISVLDLTKGYWQIPMKEEARPYTAFVTHAGHYQWKVLPFGMKNAGSTFQKVMDKVLISHRKYCRSYIDDVAIYSETWTDHIFHIDRVLETLRCAGLTVNLEKCDFGKKEVKFLGHVIGSGRHTPDPQKVEAIRRLSKPSTKSEVRSILGLASYYREYIQDFSSIVLPLTNLTKKTVPNLIPWGQKEDQAFQRLKEELVKMPTLHTPDLNKPFQLYTDASATAIGACLAQTGEDGREKPIAFFSKKLTSTQMNWSTIEREAFGVLEALRKFDTWIFGAEVQVISDHNPLTYLTQSVPAGANSSLNQD